MKVVTLYTNNNTGLYYAKYKGTYYVIPPSSELREHCHRVVSLLDYNVRPTESFMNEGFIYTGKRYHF